MVTHEPDMAAYARRVVRFVDGKVDSDGSNAARVVVPEAELPTGTASSPVSDAAPAPSPAPSLATAIANLDVGGASLGA
jgi:hypothetical protein